MRAQSYHFRPGEVFLLALILSSSATQRAISSDKPNTPRLIAVSAGAAGLIAAAHFQNYSSWWKHSNGPFHAGEDGGQYLHADKAGHFFFTYLSSDLLSRSFAWAGISRSSSFIIGAGTSFAFQLYVEIEDGFHPELGFSLGDLAADFAGATFPLLRDHSSILSNIHPKWSAVPSTRFREGSHQSVIDDYESQYFWLSTQAEKLLPVDFLPDALNLAVGFGVKHLDRREGGSIEIYVGLDCDFTKLPGDGDALVALKRALNYFHLPAPTLRLLPDAAFFGFRF